MRLIQTAGLLTLTVALGGCFQSTTILHLKADGSGTLDQRTLVSSAAIGQLKQFAQLSGSTTQSAAPDPLSEEQARALAANIGPGVTYVSSTPIKTEGMEGRDSLYAFPNINTLQISQQPSAPGGLKVRADSLGPPQTITFSLEPQTNGVEILRIHMPQIQQLPGIPLQLPGASAPAQGPTAQQIAMAKQMFAGMRMTIAVEPEGRVIETNSPYVDGNHVTLFDLDFDQLVANPDNLQALQDARTPEEMQAVVKTMPGLKFTMDREITIAFAPGK